MMKFETIVIDFSHYLSQKRAIYSLKQIYQTKNSSFSTFIL